MRAGGLLIRHQAWLFTALVAWTFAPLLTVAVHVLVNGGVMTGANGGDFFDQFQYLAWIRDEGTHGLASNLWVIGHTPHDYLQPMYFISGVLWRLGLSLQLAYLIWKPIGLLVLFLGCAWYVTRLVPTPRSRQTAALALAIFYQTPAYALATWTGHLNFGHRLALLLATDDATPSLQLWGFEHTAIAVGAMAIFLICAERLLAGRAPRRWTAAAALAGSWLAWLHPWQAVTVLGVLGAMFVLRPPRRRYLGLVVPALATMLPLVYGLALSHYDIWWHTFKVDTQSTGTAPWWALLASFGPLALFAALGLRRPGDDREWILLLWLVGTAAVYFLVPEFPPHALAGITVPLAVLAVRGFAAVRERLALTRPLAVALATACVAAVTAPALYNHLESVPQTLQRSVLGNVSLSQVRLTDDQHAALVYLDHARDPGGVLAPQLFSLMVPGFTGRPVFVGHGQWESPLNVALGNSFYGAISGAQRRAILRASKARFVLGDCHITPALAAQLTGLAVAVWRRGCVTVLETRAAD